MWRIITTLCAVILSAFFVVKAYFFNLNGQPIIEQYDRLPLFFSPSIITYLVIFFVFVSLFYWVYLNIKNRHTTLRLTNLQTVLFVVITIVQIVSLFQWNKERFFIALLLVCIQLLLLFILYITYPLNKVSVLRAPIAIYFSWITFDFLIKICYVFIFNEWEGFGLSNALWAVIFMTIGVLISLHLRYHHFDIAFPIVFIWGYLGIILKNGFNELFVTAASIFLIGVLTVCTIYLKKNSAKLRK